MKSTKLMDAGRGGRAIQGLFAWAEAHKGVYSENNWDTMFQTNSGVVNSITTAEDLQLKTFSRTGEWIQLNIRGENGLKRITIVKGDWTGKWKNIPVEVKIKFDARKDKNLAHTAEHYKIYHIKGGFGIDKKESLESVVELYEMVIEEMDQGAVQSAIIPLQYCMVYEYIHGCLNAIVDKVQKSKCLKEVYLIETLNWQRVNEWVESNYVEERQTNVSNLWMETHEEQMRKRFQQLMRAVKVDIIRKRYFARSKEATDRELESWDDDKVELHWQLIRKIFQVSKIRFLLMGQIKPYCYRLWTENIIAPQLVSHNLKRVREPLQTMLTMQNDRLPIQGNDHYTDERWLMLLIYVMLNQKPGSSRYHKLSRIPSVEEVEYEIDENETNEERRETGYNQHVKLRADECWMCIAKRTERIMYGMYLLESHDQKLDLDKLEKVKNRRKWKKLHERYTGKHEGYTGKPRNEGWIKHVTEKSWARSVPLIISLKRCGLICYLAEAIEDEGYKDRDIAENDQRWLDWGTELEQKWETRAREEPDSGVRMSQIVIQKEVDRWISELDIESKAKYVAKVQYERIEHHWYQEEKAREKWYLGKLPRGGRDHEVHTLFHSRKRRLTTEGEENKIWYWSPVNLGGRSIPIGVREAPAAEIANERGRIYCDQLAYHPLGKGIPPKMEPSRYKCGIHVIMSQVGIRKKQGHKLSEGAPIHPTHVMELSTLNEYPYGLMMFQSNTQPMNDKHIAEGNDTYCRAGITTALIEDQRLGKFISGLATITGGNRVSRDPKGSRQWRERCEYRERQFNTRNNPQGEPVAKKYDKGDTLHQNYDGPFLNFATCQLTDMSFKAKYEPKEEEIVVETIVVELKHEEVECKKNGIAVEIVAGKLQYEKVGTNGPSQVKGISEVYVQLEVKEKAVELKRELVKLCNQSTEKRRNQCMIKRIATGLKKEIEVKFGSTKEKLNWATDGNRLDRITERMNITDVIPNRIAEILMAIQPVTDNIISNWKDRDAKGTIVVVISGRLTQVICDIYTNTGNDSESAAIQMDRIKSDKIMGYVRTDKQSKTFIYKPNHPPYKVDGEVDPIIIDASMTEEIRGCIKVEIKAVKDQIFKVASEVTEEEIKAVKDQIFKVASEVTEEEISELVRLMTILMWATGPSEWWEPAMLQHHRMGNQEKQLVICYRRLIMLRAIEVLGDQYSPKPIEVRVRIKSEEIEDYVYQCYENSQMERAEIMVNIHMGARCMR